MEENKEKSLFRESALQQRSAAPENLYDYIKVNSTSSWLVLAACGVVLIGLLVWGFFGCIDMSKSVVGIANGSTLTFYLERGDIENLDTGLTVVCGNKQGKITDISYDVLSINDLSDTLPGGFLFQANIPEYSYAVTCTFDTALKNDVCDATILLQSMRPIDYLISQNGD